MRVIRPIEITPSKLLSTTATETYADWSVGTTYAEGEIRVYGQSKYESLQGSNTGKQPDISPEFWLRIGPSNKWAMFDNEVNTQTTGTDPLIVEVQPGKSFTSASFVNLDATNINVKVYDAPAGNLVFEEDINLDDTIITDWFEYFFEEYDIRTDAYIENLPPYIQGAIKVSFTGGVGSTKVGGMLVGTTYEIGYTQYGLNYGIRDYSIKETDEFGETTFVKRNFSKRMDPTVMVDNTRLNQISKVLENIRATPTTWIGTTDNRFQGTIVYGFLKDYNIEINYPTSSLVRLEIEGLI
jgi:hypothetical protein